MPGKASSGPRTVASLVTDSASDAGSTVQQGVFLRFPTSAIMTTSERCNTLSDPRGSKVNMDELIMWDGGANANGYLEGSLLDMIDVTYLETKIPVITTNGPVSVTKRGFNPLIGASFMFFEKGPCCILGEGCAVDLGWRVEYETPQGSILQPRYVDVTINDTVLRFERYSNNLFYMRLSVLVDELQASTSLSSNTVIAVTTRSQTGVPAGTSFAPPPSHRRARQSNKKVRFDDVSQLESSPVATLGEVPLLPVDLLPKNDPYLHQPLVAENSVDPLENPKLNFGEVYTHRDSVPVSQYNNRKEVEDPEMERSPDLNLISPQAQDNLLKEDAVPTSPTDRLADKVPPIPVELTSDEPVFNVRLGAEGAEEQASPPQSRNVQDEEQQEPGFFADYVTKGTAAGYSKDTLEKDVTKLCHFVYELHKVMGCMPYDRLAEMIELGKIPGPSGLTAKMVRMAAHRLPPCDICTKVKFRQGAQRSVQWYSGVQADGDPHNLRVDLMYTKAGRKGKAPVLVTTDEVTGFTNLAYLNSRSMRDVESAMRKMITFLEKHGIAVGTIKSDREGAFIEMGKDKYRFEYTAGPGTHDSIAEATIRALKELFVCKREGLSFHLPKSLYPRLMEHVCVLYNGRLRRGATETPWEKVTGKQFSASDLIQGSFGRIGLFKIPDEEIKKRKLDDLVSHTEYGVVIGFEPATPRNLRVYLPARREIVTRRAGAQVTNPQPIIDLMNKIAAEEDGGVEDTDASNDVFVQTFYGLYKQTESNLVIPQLMLTTHPTNSNNSTVAMLVDSQTHPFPYAPVIMTSVDTDFSLDTKSPLSAPSDATGLTYEPYTGASEYYIPPGMLENMTISQAKSLLPEQLVNNAVINEIINNMSTYNVWKFCLPSDVIGKHILPSKFFLKSKFTPTGLFDKLKGRLVSGGHRQKPDEFQRTSAPTVDFSSFCLLVSLVRYLGASMATVDVPAAYLNTPLKEDIYMRLKQDIVKILLQHDPSLLQFVCSDGTIIVQLNKCLYGLKQSGAEWHDLLVDFLKSLGYTQSQADRCVFFKSHADGKLDLLCIHVDDLLFVYTNEADFKLLKSLFVERFGSMNFVEGSEHSYLGMSLIVLEDRAVYLSQIGYTRSLLSQYCQWRGLSPANLRAYKTPSSDNLMELKLQSDYGDLALREKVFSFVYSLMYLAQRTRPDILFTATFMTTIVDRPPPDITKHLDHLFGYLSGTISRGILLGATTTAITVYADASYAIHPDGKSHTGIFISIGENGDGGPILTQSIKQKLVTLSSTEAELVALVDSLKRLQPIRRLLDELKLLLLKPAKVMQDNKSTITIGKAGEGYSGKSKHMRVRYHAIAEQVANGEIELLHCPTTKMLADILTKPGGGSSFTDLVEAIVKGIDIED